MTSVRWFVCLGAFALATACGDGRTQNDPPPASGERALPNAQDPPLATERPAQGAQRPPANAQDPISMPLPVSTSSGSKPALPHGEAGAADQ